ncbi:MAG: DUF2817 domain-containing protein [Gammaproteobacteria bacterium]|nr:DUF2817 domain-containing protein [Gammaproteobacteria bacterium]
MKDSPWWPDNYFASRVHFMEQAMRANAKLDSHQVNAVGPDNQALFIDVASLISQNDTHRLFITSGVHGVEGFIGAAIQNQVMAQLEQSGTPNQTGVILIHAANPWGFAHLRRVNEHNIDINRNFFDIANTKSSNFDSYAKLNSVINPNRPPTRLGELSHWAKVSKLIAQHRGIRSLAGPIAAGQAEFPKGLFYAGSSATESSTTLQELVLNFSKDVEDITILDVHSGLGPSGKVTLIGNTNRLAKSERQSTLQRHYEQPVILDDAYDNAYNAQGSWCQWCQRALNDKRFLYLCIEIGTVNPIKLFSALRRENQAHHWSKINSAEYVKTKRALLNVFAPRTQQWKESAIAEAMHTIDTAFKPG